MYEEFFGLTSSPFQLSPDPFFMIPSERSQEALAWISDAIRLRKGFAVMTGEVGTGKTLVVRCLIERLEQEEISFAYFIGPRLSTTDFLSYIAFELGLTVADPTKGNLLRALYVFLLDQFEKGLTTVLIIDEAHQMPRSVLEEIRLLTNFETAQQKLIQIVLVGQPELDKKLDQVELRSLKQRIAVRCQLEPLRREDVRHYIERRLELSGAGSQAFTLFPPETVEAVYRYSHGIPRLVNSICDQALAAACLRKIRVIPAEVIKSVASHFRLEPAPAHKPAEKPLSLVRHPERLVPESPSQAEFSPSEAGAKMREATPSALRVDENAIPLTQTALAKMAEEPKRSAAGEISISHDRKLPLKDIAAPEHPAPAAAHEAAAAAVGTAAALPTRRPAELTAFQRQEAASAAAPQSVTPAEQERRDRRVSQFRSWLKPGLRLTLIIGFIAIVPAALATGLYMARHQKAPVVAAAPLTMPKQSVPVGAAITPVHAVTRSIAANPVAEPVKHAVPPAATERPTIPSEPYVPPPRPKTAIAAPPKANPAAPARLTSAEPPPPMATQPKEPEIGNAVIGSSLSAAPAAESVVSNAASSPATQPRDTSVGNAAPASPAAVLTPSGPSVSSHLEPPRLMSSPAPTYPSVAEATGVGGPVLIDAVVDETGKVTDMKVLSGNPVLRKAAMDGLRSWRYEPARLNGKPTATHIQVRINFTPH